MCKRTLLIREVVGRYHSAFKRNPQRVREALRWPRMYSVEYLVEQSFAHVGKYNHTDAAHCDYSDGSDSKTASIRSVNAIGRKRNSYRGEISGVVTAGGGAKNGGLRCVIYNPHRETLMYYYLPKSWWKDRVTRHPTSGVGKIVFSYNAKTDTIPQFEQYRVDSFKSLALAVG